MFLLGKDDDEVSSGLLTVMRSNKVLFSVAISEDVCSGCSSHLSPENCCNTNQVWQARDQPHMIQNEIFPRGHSPSMQQPPLASTSSAKAQAKAGLVCALAGAQDDALLVLNHLCGYANTLVCHKRSARQSHVQFLSDFYGARGSVINIDVILRHVKFLVDAGKWDRFVRICMDDLADDASSDGLSSTARFARALEEGEQL